MASLDHRLNSLFSIKECMTCGALYTADFCCSKGGLEDKILVPKPPQNCATCGEPVDGLNCRHCVFVRKCLNEGWYTIHDENKILNTSKSSKHNTNVVSAPQEPFVFNQDPGENSSQSPLQINHNCCYKCGDLLDGIFCQQCTCKSCGNGAHIGYNCLPKAPIISNPEQCNQTINELPQTLPSVHPTCNYEDENSFTYDSKPNSFNDSPSVPQLHFETYLCELCGNNAHYGYDCPPQFLLPQQYTVNHPILNAQKEFLNSQNKLMEQMTSICDMVGQIMQKKEEERRIMEEQAATDRHWKIPICYDDDEDYTITITPVLSTKGPIDSLIMEDEHLDTISSIENLVPIPSEFKGISEDTCDVPICEDPSTFDALSSHSEILSDYSTSSDDDSYENIEYVEPNQGGLTSVVISDNSNEPHLELPEFESFHFDLDPSFPRPPPEPPNAEISLIFKTDAPVINNFDELNKDECFDPGGGENNVKVDDSFTFVTWTFLPFLTYPETW
ncbi:hypothetical protein Tco_0332451 [Tanacetum coccineum]